MSVRWVSDPTDPTGGYFVDAEGRRLPRPAYDPATGTWSNLPGQQQPASPEGPPTPDRMSMVLSDWAARHGGQVGGAFTVDPQIDEWDEVQQKNITRANPNPTRRYTFKDGSVLEITDQGEVRGTKEVEPKEPQEARPKENDTRTSIREGRNVTETFKGGQWVVTSVGDEAVPGEGKPKENDTRTSIREGRNVTETFKGGQWVVTAIGEEAVPGEAKPRENDTRESVREGRNVTETFKGGQWVVSKIGEPAVPGQAKEGDTRELIREGRNVTETYRGGSWVPTRVGGRAIPEPPTAVTGSSDQPYLLTRDPDTGTLTQERNPNYRPKTVADVAARTGQLRAAMDAKKAELQAKVGENYSREQAFGDYERWYNQTVRPEIAALDAAQEEALYARGKEQATQKTAAYTAAQQAGQLALDAYRAQAPRRVGPGAGAMFGGALNAINKAAGLPEQDYSALITKAPNIMRETPEQATNRVLAAISPTAAANAGQATPNYAGVNIGNELALGPAWMPPAAAGAGGGGGGGGTGGGTVTRGTLTVSDTHPQADWIRRDAADRQLQLQQGPIGQLARRAGVNVNDLVAAAASTGLSPEAYLRMTGEYGAPQPAPQPVPQPPSQAWTSASAALQQRVPMAPTRWQPPTAAPVPAPAPVPPPYVPTPDESLARLGGGFEPQLQAPGFGYDPSNILPPALSPSPAVEATVPYDAAPYQFPGMEGIYDAARSMYRSVPRVQFGPGGWRNPNVRY
jgi:hypothetical protein